MLFSILCNQIVLYSFPKKNKECVMLKNIGRLPKLANISKRKYCYDRKRIESHLNLLSTSRILTVGLRSLLHLWNDLELWVHCVRCLIWNNIKLPKIKSFSELNNYIFIFEGFLLVILVNLPDIFASFETLKLLKKIL